MAKPSKRASTQKSNPSTSSSTKKDKSPSPAVEFTQVPPSLSKLVEPLSRDHIYLLHLDTQPRAIKRQIFILPLFLNILVIAVILYRCYAGTKTYPPILLSLLDGRSPAGFDTASASWALIASTIAQRTLTFLIDYFLLALFLPWPVRFWSGPLFWRRCLGFQNVEVVVRKSRPEWSDELRGHPRSWIRSSTSSGSGSEGGDVFKDRIIPAIQPERLKAKTGYLMIDADWDLDFAAMVRAHGIVDSRQGEVGGKRKDHFEPFMASVLVHGGDDSGWLVWRLEQQQQPNGGGGDEDKMSVDDMSESQRDKIMEFKNRLSEMGKEDLFFRWIELVQFHSTQAGGFTPEKQRKAMEEVQALFQKNGVDFEKFWADVGGMEGVTM